jgi:hypothetical protein
MVIPSLNWWFLGCIFASSRLLYLDFSCISWMVIPSPNWWFLRYIFASSRLLNLNFSHYNVFPAANGLPKGSALYKARYCNAVHAWCQHTTYHLPWCSQCLLNLSPPLHTVVFYSVEEVMVLNLSSPDPKFNVIWSSNPILGHYMINYFAINNLCLQS